jgi:beta-glucosidase
MTDTIPYYKIATMPVEKRVQDLITRMTLEEKISQLYQIWDLPHNRDQAKNYVRKWGVGSRILASSLLSGSGLGQKQSADEINEWQRIAVEETRLGIPILFGRDVIHGFRTIFPIPLGMAAAFDPDLVEQAFIIAAREAASAGVNWAFAPMLDIARDPRWGRIAEGNGEDPYLGSRNAAAAVYGFQGRTPEENSAPDRVLACAKHYIGYGAAEGGRDYNTVEISDNTLRNIYLPPFIAAVNAGLGSVMSGFHDLNGESVSGSYYLLTQILKNELGFAGFVISDWGSVWELINHRVAENEADAAQLGLNSGVDMEMATTCYSDHIKSLVEKERVSMDRMDDAVRRILTAKFRFGLFEHPYADPTLAAKVQFTPANQNVARQIAVRSMVLLKNEDGILPLPKQGKKIAMLGPLLDERMALLGSWTIDGREEETQTVWDAVNAVAPELLLPHTSTAMTDEMLLAAIRADIVVFLAGESHSRSGENNNVAAIELPPGQTEIIEAICDLGKPVVLVIFAGRAINLSRVARRVSAILYAWHPGSLGATALANVLFGDAEPGGRLPVSLPRHAGQIPVHYNFKSTGKSTDMIGRKIGEEYREVARYQDQLSSPLYPFGHGLGYTTFSYSNIHIDRAEIRSGETLTISALVSNTGPRAGEEVVQCYLQDCTASITRPVRELKGFSRVLLNPGESVRVNFVLGPQEMSFYALDGKFKLEPGLFKAWIGPDCHAALEVSFRVTL